MKKVSDSYTKYFNLKYKRNGPLFQGQFKAVHVESDEQLIHLSRYIHLNPIAGYVTKNLEEYKWSSYSEYVGSLNGICFKNPILDLFTIKENNYEQFLMDQVDYARKLETLKHKLLE